MKYCLNYKQDSTLLAQCQEIKLPYSAGENIIDLMDINSKADFIVIIPREKDKDFHWDRIARWNTMTQNRIICCLFSLEDATTCARHNLRFYLGYPIDSFYDLRGVINLGVCYVCIGPELFFNLPKVQAFNVPIRIAPNLAQYNFIPMPDGVCGQWVRPEDQFLYAQNGVGAIEFEQCSVKEEELLYKVYAIYHSWSGELQEIVSNLNHKGLNKKISADVIEHRLSCNHQCQKGRSCRLCHRAFD